MSKKSPRLYRVEELIRRELAQILQREIRDPRIGMVTISEVEVARDLAQAKIFVSILDDAPEKIKITMDSLKEAAGFLRTELAHKVSLRTTPRLIFVYDDSIARGNRISRLIDETMAKENDPEDEPSED